MKWISVKDQLPPLDTDVLGFLENPPYNYIGATHMQVVKIYERLVSEWETEESKSDRIRWTCFDKVLYWMPLPDHPELSK